MADRVINEILEFLEGEITTLQNQINTKNKSLTALKRMADQIKQYDSLDEYKEKYQETNKQLEKEKERLVKLYNQYENKQQECSTLREDIRNWQTWFDTNKELFDRLLNAAPPKGITKQNSSNTPPQTPSKPKKILKKKKKT